MGTRTRLPGITLRDAAPTDADAVMRLLADVNPDDPHAFEDVRRTCPGLLPPPGRILRTMTIPLSATSPRGRLVLADTSAGGVMTGGRRGHSRHDRRRRREWRAPVHSTGALMSDVPPMALKGGPGHRACASADRHGEPMTQDDQ